MAKKNIEKKKRLAKQKSSKPKPKTKKVLTKKTSSKPKHKAKSAPTKGVSRAKPAVREKTVDKVKKTKTKPVAAKPKTPPKAGKTKAPQPAKKKMLKVVRTPVAAPANTGNPKEDKAPPKALDPALIKIKEKLMTSRQELFRMIESSQELERNVSDLTFSNEIDLASSLEGREMVFQLASRDRNELKMINDALFKMAKGIYGVCESCSKPIGIKRLQIMPLTRFCIDCQESMETPA